MANQLCFLADRIATPIGELILLCDASGCLRAIDWTDHEQRMLRLLSRQYHHQEIVTEPSRNPFGRTAAIAAYFRGDLLSIQSIPVATAGTVFQQSVWQSLRSIPAGETISYGTLAKRIGRPAAVRAVGLANGANPISIVIPCHRVIGANASLTGYGGGLDRKRWLLDHERKHSQANGISSQLFA